jgi:hypothetical protein
MRIFHMPTQMPQWVDRYSPCGIQPGVAGWEARSKIARSKKPGQGRLDSHSRASSPKKANLQGAQKNFVIFSFPLSNGYISHQNAI